MHKLIIIYVNKMYISVSAKCVLRPKVRHSKPWYRPHSNELFLCLTP